MGIEAPTVAAVEAEHERIVSAACVVVAVCKAVVAADVSPDAERGSVGGVAANIAKVERLIPLTQVPLDVVSAIDHPFCGRSGTDSDGEGALTRGISTGFSQR